MEMFCRQCEQTAAGKGCSVKGVCGKTSNAAVLQDLIIYSLKGIAPYARRAAELGITDKDTEKFFLEALFSTITNVNFDEERLKGLILKSSVIKNNIKRLFLEAYKNKEGKDFQGSLNPAASWEPKDDLEWLLEEGRKHGILSEKTDDDVQSLKELLLYGLKGMAAYADHAYILGKADKDIFSFIYKGIEALAERSLKVEDMLGLNMEFGKVNFKCLQILDEAHTGHFGHPVPAKVQLGVKKGPAILISGHDLLDLEELLKQTQGKGINIYTHGEMLPAHGYPGLKKYPHLYGHFGGAWQDQQKEFDEFPGAILMTTNCIQKPRDTYSERIFTTGLVAWPQVKHIEAKGGKKDFSALIDKAIAAKGFKEDAPAKEITVGFGHNTVLSIAGKVIDAVKNKKIRHFFLVGGCDGAKSGRNYYTDFVAGVPKDCVVLTLACGKFRFNKQELADIEGIPRLLDCGQCNDAYSAIKIALALADAFKCSVNELPLSLVLSWYEQKAVCILITLLSLGIKNIRLGPTLPAFVSPNVLKVLVESFSVKPISNPEDDLKAILG